MCAADLLGEHFGSDLLKAALCLPALEGTWTGPWSPGNAMTLLRRAALAGPGIEGGAPMLVDALHKAAVAQGVEIRTEAEVTRIEVGGGRVKGVTLASGETIAATRVAASCHPRLALDTLLPPGTVDYRLAHRVRTFRSRGSVAHVALALRKPPQFAVGRAGDKGVQWARTGAHVDELERAFDAIKYGEVSAEPILDIAIPSVADPSLAPKDHAVLTATVYFAPHERRGGWDNAARTALGDTVVRTLARHDSQLPEHVVARRVLTPADLEREYALPGGHLFHGEHSLDQLMVRPSPECIHYRTPIEGLFVCGSGTHPGGGLTCGPGYFAASSIASAP